ncbi:MAG TPA: twin-arginine translocase subunit TatC [Gemmatimonadales bacterium]
MYTSPTEPFFITLKLAFAAGVLLASPIIIYQVWAFLAPALYERERRVILPSLVVGLALFCAGGAAAYFLVLPRALVMLGSFQQADLAPIITAEKYFGFAVPLILAFGAITELPLVMVILAGFGLVTPAFLSRNRRYALVVAAAVAAFLAPPDALSMVMMMVPLMALYEVSIWCVWVVTRRRARRAAAESAAGRVTAVLLGAVLVGAGALRGQQPPVVPRPDTTRRAGQGVPGAPVKGAPLDTATARRLGLPTAPSRSFPASDAVIDSLMALKGFRKTRYVADTLRVTGDSGNVELRSEAFVEQEGTKLEADSIRYRQGSCRLDAQGSPRLFDQNSVLVGSDMRYDTCVKRGTISDALTDFQQGGATWYMRGHLAVDSGSTRMFGARSDITSDEQPVPDYHFAAGEVKWLNKNVMVARPAVLYVRDVPIVWMPFILQDIRTGRRSGILVPRFGLNDIVRPTRSYQRHIANVGYYWVVNDYIDLLASADWFANRSATLNGQLRYRWLDQFVQGGIAYSHMTQLDGRGSSTRIGWSHQQAFDSRTHFNAHVDYATSGSIIQTNTVDYATSLAQLTSQASFDKRFSWGAINIGGSRSQNLSTQLVSQTFPQVSLTPASINIGSIVSWSPSFSYANAETYHNLGTPLLVAAGGGLDTLPQSYDVRATSIAFQTPLRIGSWNWSNAFQLSDAASNQRREYLVKDPTDPTKLRRVLYDRSFETRVDWSTGIGLPSLFPGSWKLQPGIQILNQTTQGPTAIRNQFTHGRFVTQGKRLAFSAGLSPTFFGFFPGVGPVTRIRHSVQILITYLYAPASKVSSAFANAIDPSGLNLAARSDPQQTISLGLSQTFDAKLRPAPGDTSGQEPKKIKLLSISTSSISYNIERAKTPGLTGWQTQSLSNTVASDLLPGLNLQFTHNLWDGAVGYRGTKFSPFLTDISAGFTITPATLRGIGALLGIASRAPAAPAAPAPGAPPPPTVPGPILTQPAGGVFRGQGPSYYAGGARTGGFNLRIDFTSHRDRPLKDSTTFNAQSGASPYQGQPPVFFGQNQAGRTQMNVQLSFSPTPHWTASWNTTYDLETQQFAQHFVSLERDLHRWHARFSFAKSPNGNLAFSFNIALLDEPDIKFDYDQQSYRVP